MVMKGTKIARQVPYQGTTSTKSTTVKKKKLLAGVTTKSGNGFVDRKQLHDKLVRYNEKDQALGRERISSIALLNKSIQAQFKEQAKAFKHVLSDMPELSSTDVIRLCVHLSLQKEDFESAARWAKELVEFERPKLSRREVIEKDETEGMSDDELQAALKAEGLVSFSAEKKRRKGI